MKQSCPYCENTHLYRLKDGRLECSTCKLRHSPEKIQKGYFILDACTKELSPKDASLSLKTTLPTILAYYGQIRSLLPQFLEQIYLKESSSYREYEEYLFLPKYKRNKKDCLIEGVGIMGLFGKGGVYTLLMPDHWKSLDSNIKMNPDFIETLAHYYQWNKLIRIDSRQTPIGKFWHFLEEFMGKFHGIKEDYFGLYLKEAEFRFNFTKEEQAHHLMRLWKEHLKQKLRSRNSSFD